MARVVVWVGDWQLACCGQPFELGSAVAWTLRLRPAGKNVLADEVVSLDGVLERVGDLDLKIRGSILHAGNVHAYWAEERPVDGRVRLRGCLYEERHGGVPDAMPPTRGVVRRIRAVEAAWPEGERPRAWPPTKVTLREQHDSFLHFPDKVKDDGLRWFEPGLLVDVDVVPDD